jgi:hypothetical protein
MLDYLTAIYDKWLAENNIEPMCAMERLNEELSKDDRNSDRVAWLFRFTRCWEYFEGR